MSSPEPMADLITPEQYTELTGEVSPSALALSVASSAIREYCGWHIAPVVDGLVHTRVMLGRRTPAPAMITLPCLTLVDVEQVTVDGEVFPLLENEWDQAGIIAPQWPWTANSRLIRVTYSAGRDVVPPVLISLAKTLIERDGTPANIAQRTTMQRTITYSRGTDGAGFTEGEKSIMDRYRVKVRS